MSKRGKREYLTPSQIARIKAKEIDAEQKRLREGSLEARGSRGGKASRATRQSPEWKMKLKLSRKAKFRLIYDDRNKVVNAGIRPWVNSHVKLSRVMRAELIEPAPPELLEELQLPPGSNFARAICRCACLQAGIGDHEAQRFVRDTAEAQKVGVNLFQLPDEKFDAVLHALNTNPFQLPPAGGAIDV